MPWLRLWVDILDSEKLAGLDDSTYRGWTLVLLSAKRFDRGGLLPPLARIVYWVRRPESEVKTWIEKLKRAGLLDGGKDGPRVHDWEYWQEPKDRTNSRRQKDWRVRQKGSLDSPKTEEETETEQSRAEQTVTPPPLRNAPVTASNGVRNSTVTPLRGESTASDPIPEPHPTDSPAARKVVADAVRRWGAIDLDAEIQANELVRTWGAKLADHGLDKAFKKLGTKERPWAYANVICRGGLPPPGSGGNGKPQPATNQPGGPSPEELARIEAELAKKPKLSRKAWEEANPIGKR